MNMQVLIKEWLNKLLCFGQTIARDIAIIVSFPLLLICANEQWITPIGWLDNWFYIGYFFRPKMLLNAQVYWPYPWSKEFFYPDTRLSWILPGWISFSIFPPIIENRVLILTFYLAATISLYLILRLIANSRTGLFTAILLGGYSYFLFSIGWGYTDGPGMAYFLLAVLMFTLAAKGIRWRSSLLFAGGFYGCLIYSNTTWIAYTPALIMYYWWLNCRERRNSLLKSILLVILGFLSLTALFGVINYTLTGNFLFFMPALQYILKGGSTIHWTNEWLPSLADNPALSLVALVFIVSLLICLLGLFSIQLVSSPAKKIILFLYLVMVMTAVLMEWRGFPAMRYIFYSSYLLPSAFLAIGVILDAFLTALQAKYFWGLTLGLTIVVLGSYSRWFHFLSWLTNFWSGQDYLSFLWVGLTILFLTFGIVSLGEFMKLSWLSRKKLISSVFAVVLVGLYFLLNPILSNSWKDVQPEKREMGLLAMVDAIGILEKEDPAVNAMFWYDANEESSAVYISLFGSCLGSERLVSTYFPGLNFMSDQPAPDQRIEQVKSLLEKRQRILLLSEKEQFSKAAEVMKSIGVQTKKLSEHKIKRGSVMFNMTLIETSQKSL